MDSHQEKLAIWRDARQQVPKGWVRRRAGQKVQSGDLIWLHSFHKFEQVDEVEIGTYARAYWFVIYWKGN